MGFFSSGIKAVFLYFSSKKSKISGLGRGLSAFANWKPVLGTKLLGISVEALWGCEGVYITQSEGPQIHLYRKMRHKKKIWEIGRA